MNSQKLKILASALSKMPQFFTSSQFGVKVRELGGDLSYGKTGLITNFLNCEAKKLGNQRWENKHYSSKSFDDSFNESDISKAITLLKSHGYKIYKTIEI